MFFYLIIVYFLQAKAEIVSEDVSSVSQASSQNSCREYAKQRPDLVNDLDLEDGPRAESSLSLRQRAQLCASGVGAAWKDTIRELFIDPYNFMVKASPAQTKSFLDNCNKFEPCKRQLFYEAHGREPSGKESSKLSSNLSFSELDVLYRNAKSRMNSTGEQNRRFRESLKNRKEIENQEITESSQDSAAQEKSSFWTGLNSLINQEQQKWSCLKSEAAQELFCYYLATVIDPTIAAGIVAKAPKLAKLAKVVNLKPKTKLVASVKNEKLEKAKELAANNYLNNQQLLDLFEGLSDADRAAVFMAIKKDGYLGGRLKTHWQLFPESERLRLLPHLTDEVKYDMGSYIAPYPYARQLLSSISDEWAAKRWGTGPNNEFNRHYRVHLFNGFSREKQEEILAEFGEPRGAGQRLYKLTSGVYYVGY